VSVIPGPPYSAALKRPVEPGAKIGLLHLLMLVALALSVTIWWALLVAGGGSHELARFITADGFFAVACAFFVLSRVRGGLQGFFELPVFMTVVAFVEFGLAPISCFLDPDALAPQLHGDTALFNPALLIVLAGMVAFWLGSTAARSKKQAPADVDPVSLPGSGPRSLTLLLGGCLYLTGFAAKVYMLRSGWFGYLQSQGATQAHIAEAQVWIVISSFGFYALILFSIEAYWHPGDKFRAVLFWTVLASEGSWGLMSGMKGPFLFSLVAVSLVSSVAGRELRIRWFVVATLCLIAIYPLINQYRSLVGTRMDESVNSVSAATEAMRGAAAQTSSQERTAGHWLTSGWSSSVARLNMTQNVALLLTYQDRSYLLEGKERLWMIPFYPFVPRLLWPGKPLQDYGGRFSKLLGLQGDTSTSPTVPGDLYILHYGIAGVAGGMFLIGLVAQWLTNPVKLWPSKRNLFIYGCVFFTVANWENDFFGYSSPLIRTFVIVQVLAALIYGPARASSRLGRKKETRN